MRASERQAERRRTVQHRALGVLAAAAFAAILWVSLPVALGLILGALVAFTLQPLYRKLARRTRRPVLAATLCSAAATGVTAGAMVLLVYLLVVRGADVLAKLPAALAPHGPVARAIDAIGHPFAPLGVHGDKLVERARDSAGDAAVQAAPIAAGALGSVLDLVVGIFFLALTTFAVLRSWSRVVRRAEQTLPIAPRHTRALLESLRTTSRRVMLGTVVTGLVQGTLAGIGYAVTGVEQPAFFGALTAVASLLPALGTLFVWVPLGIWLLATGHPAAGGIELVYGALVVVGLCDSFLRPLLVGSKETMKLFPTLVALFGGLKVFGFLGLLIGPIVFSIAFDTLTIWRRERTRVAGARVHSRAWPIAVSSSASASRSRRARPPSRLHPLYRRPHPPR